MDKVNATRADGRQLGEEIEFFLDFAEGARPESNIPDDYDLTFLPVGLTKHSYQLTPTEDGVDLWLLLPTVGARKVPVRASEGLKVSSLLEAVSKGAAAAGAVALECGTEVIVRGRYRGSVRISLDRLTPSIHLKWSDAIFLAYQLRVASYNIDGDPMEGMERWFVN